MTKARNIAELANDISVDNNRDVTLSNLRSDQPMMFRNLLINGDMRISQRGDVTGITSNTYGGPDRFQHIMGSAGTFSISQSTDAPDGFSNSIKVACTSATSLSTGTLYLLGQKTEGQNNQHLKFGTSNAKSLTLSFWVKTNVAGDYAVEFVSETAQRQISKSFNISASEASAFDWVQRILTIPGDTVAEIPNNTTAELAFYIWLCAGTNYTSGTLNSSSWNSSTDTNRALAMNLGSSTSNEFYITGVQLEEGTVPTPFEHLPYGTELALCQRYYFKTFNQSVVPAQNVGSQGALGGSSAVDNKSFTSTLKLPVSMRIPPNIITTYSTTSSNSNWGSQGGKEPTPSVLFVGESSISVRALTNISAEGAHSIHVTAEAEL